MIKIFLDSWALVWNANTVAFFKSLINKQDANVLDGIFWENHGYLKIQLYPQAINLNHLLFFKIYFLTEG